MNDPNGAAEPQRHLDVPIAERRRYKRNFIRQAVCELRFPTIFEIEDKRPPAVFWNTLKRDFQTHELVSKLNVSPGKVEHGNAHRFISSRGRWTATLRSSAVSVETTQYISFEDFEKHLSVVLKAAGQTIDSDFYTRVGLRYINLLPCKPADVKGWINSALIAPLATPVLGTVLEFANQIRGSTVCGGYYIQHGFGMEQGSGAAKEGYVLDFDLYSEDVPVAKVWETISMMHDLEHSLFRWAIGPDALAFLEKGV